MCVVCDILLLKREGCYKDSYELFIKVILLMIMSVVKF